MQNQLAIFHLPEHSSLTDVAVNVNLPTISLHCLISLDIWHKIGAISVKQATIGKVFSKHLIAEICTSNVKRF